VAQRPDALIAVAAGICGALGINLYLAAVEVGIWHVATLEELSQWDASNVLGNAAYEGGWAAASLGFGMHLIVSIAWAASFVYAARRVGWIREKPLRSGTALGLIVLAAMQILVLPLGHAIRPSYSVVKIANLIVAHVVFFGLAVAYVTNRSFRAPSAAKN
jgi:hypothetical protein